MSSAVAVSRSRSKSKVITMTRVGLVDLVNMRLVSVPAAIAVNQAAISGTRSKKATGRSGCRTRPVQAPRRVQSLLQGKGHSQGSSGPSRSFPLYRRPSQFAGVHPNPPLRAVETTKPSAPGTAEPSDVGGPLISPGGSAAPVGSVTDPQGCPQELSREGRFRCDGSAPGAFL
jgi:hypothetical protein